MWAYDFVEDRTEGGRKLRILTVADEFTRECVTVEVECERQLMMRCLETDADDPAEFFKELRGTLLCAPPPVHGSDESNVVGFWRPE